MHMLVAKELMTAQVALNIPDELTLDHIWKEKKREYAFDAVFAPGIGQEKARTANRWHQAGVLGQAPAGNLHAVLPS